MVGRCGGHHSINIRQGTCNYRHTGATDEDSSVRFLDRQRRPQRKQCRESLQRASVQVNQIIEEIPEEWNVPQSVVKEKLIQLLDERWTADVWDNFMKCLNDNTR